MDDTESPNPRFDIALDFLFAADEFFGMKCTDDGGFTHFAQKLAETADNFLGDGVLLLKAFQKAQKEIDEDFRKPLSDAPFEDENKQIRKRKIRATDRHLLKSDENDQFMQTLEHSADPENPSYITRVLIKVKELLPHEDIASWELHIREGIARSQKKYNIHETALG